MATGNRLATFGALNNEPPATAPMTFDVRNAQPVLDGDADADESMIVSSVLPAYYAGGGIRVKVHYSMSSATSGNVRLDAAIERVGDEVQDTDSDGFAVAQSVTDAVPATNGHVGVATIDLSNAQIDGLLVGEEYRLKVTRDADNVVEDTASGDIEIKKVTIDEQ
jgi:hypothetical protein